MLHPHLPIGLQNSDFSAVRVRVLRQQRFFFPGKTPPNIETDKIVKYKGALGWTSLQDVSDVFPISIQHLPTQGRFVVIMT